MANGDAKAELGRIARLDMGMADWRGGDKWPDVVEYLKEKAASRGITYEQLVVNLLIDDPKPVATPDCCTIELLAKAWPHLPDAQLAHLQQCDFCQAFISIAFPVVYLKPSPAAVAATRKEVGLLGKCLASPDLDCFEGIGDKKLEHISKCSSCRDLVATLVLKRGRLASRRDVASFHSFHNMVKRYQFWCRMHDIYATGPCPRQVAIGNDLVVFLPTSGMEEHVQRCSYCKFLFYCYRSVKYPAHYGCLGDLAWQTYPVFHSEDGYNQHVRECDFWCQPWAALFFGVNAARDRHLFSNYKRRSAWTRKLLEKLQWLKRQIGYFISSWRFHCSSDGPFAMRHRWVLWNDKDSMLKLVSGEALSEEEKLYLEVLEDRKPPTEAMAELAKMLPRDYEHGAFTMPVENYLRGHNHELLEALRLEVKAEDSGLPVEVVEAQERAESDRAIEAMEKELEGREERQ